MALATQRAKVRRRVLVFALLPARNVTRAVTVCLSKLNRRASMVSTNFRLVCDALIVLTALPSIRNVTDAIRLPVTMARRVLLVARQLFGPWSLALAGRIVSGWTPCCGWVSTVSAGSLAVAWVPPAVAASTLAMLFTAVWPSWVCTVQV